MDTDKLKEALVTLLRMLDGISVTGRNNCLIVAAMTNLITKTLNELEAQS